MFAEAPIALSPSPALREREGPIPKGWEGEGAGGARAILSLMAEPRARELRIDMTDAERRLWSALRGRRLERYKFRR